MPGLALGNAWFSVILGWAGLGWAGLGWAGRDLRVICDAGLTACAGAARMGARPQNHAERSPSAQSAILLRAPSGEPRWQSIPLRT